jgi:hypothetical protein
MINSRVGSTLQGHLIGQVFVVLPHQTGVNPYERIEPLQHTQQLDEEQVEPVPLLDMPALVVHDLFHLNISG